MKGVYSAWFSLPLPLFLSLCLSSFRWSVVGVMRARKNEGKKETFRKKLCPLAPPPIWYIYIFIRCCAPPLRSLGELRAATARPPQHRSGQGSMGEESSSGLSNLHT